MRRSLPMNGEHKPRRWSDRWSKSKRNVLLHDSPESLMAQKAVRISVDETHYCNGTKRKKWPALTKESCFCIQFASCSTLVSRLSLWFSRRKAFRDGKLFSTRSRDMQAKNYNIISGGSRWSLSSNCYDFTSLFVSNSTKRFSASAAQTSI